jgi:hypothetical protein
VPDQIERVLVVGPPCSGKTTAAREIARRLDAPHVELDALWWEPDWTEAGDERFKERLSGFVSQPRWVLDGNYLSVGVSDLVLPAADTIVWLDEGRWVTVPRGAWRTLRRVALRTDLWSGNREPLGYLPRFPSLVLMAIRKHPEYNREVEELDGARNTHTRWVRLRGRRAVQDWLRSL